MYDSMYSSIQNRLIMLVLVTPKHKAYRSILYYPHRHTQASLSEMFLYILCVCYSITLHMIVSPAALKVLQAAQNIPIGMAVSMGIEWHFHLPVFRTSVSPDILEYVEKLLPMSLQRRAPFFSLTDQSWPLEVTSPNIKNKIKCRLGWPLLNAVTGSYQHSQMVFRINLVL